MPLLVPWVMCILNGVDEPVASVRIVVLVASADVLRSHAFAAIVKPLLVPGACAVLLPHRGACCALRVVEPIAMGAVKRLNMYIYI